MSDAGRRIGYPRSRCDDGEGLNVLGYTKFLLLMMCCGYTKGFV